ncbi:hypothetical protein AB0D30_02850 [Streptomyces sp. NPDC048409]|uniref:hypothetical protein n=1 Tax=Streptomyces sp. NPDC048409 TaxID=3154723 RepID=UPI003445D546
MHETTQTADAAASPQKTGWCHWHKGLGDDPRQIQSVEAGSGSGAPFYACARCRRRHRLTPMGEHQ